MFVGIVIAYIGIICKMHNIPFAANIPECYPKQHYNNRSLRMKATGIVHRIDDLGRAVIPKEIRRAMRQRDEDSSLKPLTHDLMFCMGLAACYPEIHPESTGAVDDLKWLKYKTDCGADHMITQLFLDNAYFYDFQEKARIAGISAPLEAGIMPVTNKRQIERMVKLCGVALPKKFVRVPEKYEHNETALRDAGIAYAIDQITDLIAEGVDGIHLYTMNNAYIAHRIFDAFQSLISVNVRSVQ